MDGMAILKKVKQFMMLFLSKKWLNLKRWIVNLVFALAVKIVSIMDYKIIKWKKHLNQSNTFTNTHI